MKKNISKLGMEKLNEIVIDYLKVKDTDYALMINGKWGCGKTYYLEHDFKDFIGKRILITLNLALLSFLFMEYLRPKIYSSSG